jgi:hypothetical protein
VGGGGAAGATVGKREFETDGRDAPGLIASPPGEDAAATRVALRVSPPLAMALAFGLCESFFWLGGWGCLPWIFLIQEGPSDMGGVSKDLIVLYSCGLQVKYLILWCFEVDLSLLSKKKTSHCPCVV